MSTPYEPKELAKIVYTSKPLYKNSSPYEPRIGKEDCEGVRMKNHWRDYLDEDYEEDLPKIQKIKKNKKAPEENKDSKKPDSIKHTQK
jgi:hypothetical protein